MMYSKTAFGILFLIIVTFSDSCAKTRLKRQSQSSCTANEWKCSDGQCIEESEVCDGIDNCRDQSDETYKTCSNNKCLAFTFKCNYGACVGRFAKCNGLIECADKSDESSCPGSTISNLDNGSCSSEEFRCKNGECIPSEKKCDGASNCRDGSDETTESCRFLKCPNYAYICDYGACVIRTARCNNINECSDGSDEMNCGNSPTPIDFSDFFKPAGGCIIPVHPEFGNIYNPQKTMRLNAGEIAPDFSQITYTCSRGYTAIAPVTMKNLQNTCVKGQWEHTHITCSRTCSSTNLDSHTITATCSLNGSQRNCRNEPILAGTKITINCRKGYKNYNLDDVANLIVCKTDGTYTNNPWTCKEDCGKAEPSYESFIIDGTPTEIGKIPWHTAIYENKNGVYSQICGGTIISAKFVLSAAHCFWNPGRKVLYDKSNYRIAAGKTNRSYKAVENNTSPQFFDLESINIPSQYLGIEKNHMYDIAVIKVTTIIIFDTTIRSACIEYNLRGNDLFIQSNRQMLVAGWGLTKSAGEPSEQLHYIEMPTADANLCKTNTKPEFHPYITNDKFCAGFFTAATDEYDEANSAGVCKGDSGGGLMYKKGDSYYVGGIVSGGPANNGSCDGQSYATFTNVLLYADANNYLSDFSIGSFLAR